jgi:hypothetical protein
VNTPSLISVAAFLKRHGAHPRKWPRSVILPWLEWHWKNGGVGIIHDKGKVLAVGVARCINSMAESGDAYAHDEKGVILWVDELASIHPEGLFFLLNQARTRFGPRLAVVGHVFNRPGKLRMLPWKTVERLTQKIPQL